MSAVVGDVLRVALTVRHEADAVRQEETPQRMADLPLSRGVLQEAVTAVAGIFDEPLARRDRGHAMAEQPARVSNLLGEARGSREPVGPRREDQRVAAAHADVFVHAAAIREAHVGVMAEEARHCVPDVSPAAVLGQILDAAAAVSTLVSRSAEHIVVDDVAPELAADAEP